MNISLLRYLQCLDCASPLTLKGGNGEEDVVEGSLECASCGDAYPIIDGIPRFLNGALSSKEIGTRDRFAYAWRRWGPQISQSLNQEFLVRLPGWGKTDFEDKAVLDIGCGAGRLARLSVEFGARDVIAIDIGGPVLETANRLSAAHPNIHFVQANLFNLPFGSDFDIVYSMGVLHHTPDPPAAFGAIIRHVKPGGKIGVWVYSKEGNHIVGPLLNLFRWCTVHFPSRINAWIAYVLVVIQELIYTLVLRHMKSAHYGRYLDYFNNFLNREDRHYVAFDFVSTPLVHYQSQEELRQQAENNGLTDVAIEWFNHNGNSMTAVKPKSSENRPGATANRVSGK